MHRMLVEVPYQCRVVGTPAKSRSRVDQVTRRLAKVDVAVLGETDVSGHLFWKWRTGLLRPSVDVRSPIHEGRALVPLHHDAEGTQPVRVADWSEYVARAKGRYGDDQRLDAFGLPFATRKAADGHGDRSRFVQDARYSAVERTDEPQAVERVRAVARSTIFVYDGAFWTGRYEPVATGPDGSGGATALRSGDLRAALAECREDAAWSVPSLLRANLAPGAAAAPAFSGDPTHVRSTGRDAFAFTLVRVAEGFMRLLAIDEGKAGWSLAASSSPDAYGRYVALRGLLERVVPASGAREVTAEHLLDGIAALRDLSKEASAIRPKGGHDPFEAIQAAARHLKKRWHLVEEYAPTRMTPVRRPARAASEGNVVPFGR